MPEPDSLPPFVQFFVFPGGCGKYPLDRPGGDGSPAGKSRNFFEKGVDFFGKVRYNLFLHKGHSMPGSKFREQEV
jgi:hypothetical protein